MGITKKDVKNVATLARLSLTKGEEELYAGQLKKILAYIDKLTEVNTDGIEPTTYTVSAKCMLREDETAPSLPKEDALKNAPDKARGYFKVPKIIE